MTAAPGPSTVNALAPLTSPPLITSTSGGFVADQPVAVEPSIVTESVIAGSACPVRQGLSR